jgi:hypothetical protein
MAVAGLTAERAGDSEGAVDLYLRAGRSAAAQSDAATARPLLEQAKTLSRNPATQAAAALALASLELSQRRDLGVFWIRLRRRAAA